MARNKRDVDPAIKREQIEEAACALFLAEGYDDTSMATVGRAAGVAPNTLYWYFASKDDLLVAVLDRLVKRSLVVMAAKQQAPLSEQLACLLAEFQQTRQLISAVHARLEQSDTIREWHDRFHAMLDNMLVQQMVSKGMTPAKAAMMATVGTYVVEGLLSHPHTAQQFDKITRWLTGQLK